MKKIGFIGTGIMGASMAGHLLDAGYELNVYNHTKAKAEGLIARGAHCAPPQESAQLVVMQLSPWLVTLKTWKKFT